MARIQLSPTQQAVIQRLLARPADQRYLFRVPGGFWTVPGTPSMEGWPNLPSWHTTIHTVRALEARGLLQRADPVIYVQGDPRGDERFEWKATRVLVHRDIVLLASGAVEIPGEPS
jgi:hypothetical protein